MRRPCGRRVSHERAFISINGSFETKTGTADSNTGIEK